MEKKQSKLSKLSESGLAELLSGLKTSKKGMSEIERKRKALEKLRKKK